MMKLQLKKSKVLRCGAELGEARTWPCTSSHIPKIVPYGLQLQTARFSTVVRTVPCFNNSCHTSITAIILIHSYATTVSPEC